MSRLKYVAAASGALIGGPLFALIGLQSDHLRFGIISGIVMGSVVGYFASTNTISRVTVGAILGASIFANLGPGVDAPGLHAAPVGAILGIVVGCLGWPWIFGILGASVGLLLGAMSCMVFCTRWPQAGPSPGQCQLVGMLAGGSLTVIAGYLVKAKTAALFKSNAELQPSNRTSQHDSASHNADR